MPCTSSNSNAYVTFWESPPSRSRTCELATASSRSGTPPGSDRCHVGPFTRHRRGPGVLIRSARARPAPMKVRLWPRQQRHCPSDAPRARCGGARRSRSGGAVRNQRGHHHCRHGGITAGQWAPRGSSTALVALSPDPRSGPRRDRISEGGGLPGHQPARWRAAAACVAPGRADTRGTSSALTSSSWRQDQGMVRAECSECNGRSAQATSVVAEVFACRVHGINAAQHIQSV